MSERLRSESLRGKESLGRELNHIRVIFLVIGLVTFTTTLLSWNLPSERVPDSATPALLLYLGCAIGIVYLMFAALTFQHPVRTTVLAVVLYATLHLRRASD